MNWRSLHRDRSVRRAGRAALGGALLLLAGCAVHLPHHHPAAHHHPRARVVVIEHGHAHSAGCGHYFHRGRWFHLAGHHHARGCGHVWAGGIWRLR